MNRQEAMEKKTVIFVSLLPTREDSTGHKRRWCIVQCPYCQKEFEILKHNLDMTRSCGCVTNELKKPIKHGFTSRKQPNRLYKIWVDMKTRCLCTSNQRYHRYGGRGITVCAEWHSFMPFYEWAIVNGYKENLTIDRVDNNGNYCPENCRWVTNHENLMNRGY